MYFIGRYCTKKLTSCTTLFIAFPILLTVLSLISLLLFHYGLHHVPSFSVASIGANSTVLASTDCYTPLWIKDVIIALSGKSLANANVKSATVYEIKQDNIHYRTDILKNVTYSYTSPLFTASRLAMNYNGGDLPLYSASNSTLTYIISIRSDINFTQCPMEIYLFTDDKSYFNFVTVIQDTINLHSADSSQCPLKVKETTQQYVFNYPLKPNTFYYVAMGALSGLSFNITLTGVITKFNLSGITPHMCSFHLDSDLCSIAITNSSIPYSFKPVCIAIQCSEKRQFNVTLSTASVTWNIGSVVSLSFFITVLTVSCAVSISVIVYIVWQHKKETRALHRYNDLLID